MLQMRLQCLRGILAMLVVVSHLAHWLVLGTETSPNPYLISVGSFSVAVFFVISGYIMGYVHEKDIDSPLKLKAYALKRVFRIFPAYLFFLILTVGVLSMGFASPEFGSMQNMNLGEWVSAVTLFPLIPASSSPLIVAWSLYYEMFFYFVFGCLIFNRWLGIAAFSIFIILSLLNKPASLIHVFCLNKINILFAAGLLLNWYHKTFSHGRGLYTVLLLIGSALLLKGVVHLDKLNSLVVYVGSTLVVMGVVGLDIRRPVEKPDAFLRVLIYLGSLSYSLYLGHIFAQTVVYHFLGAPDSLVKGIVFVALPVVVAVGSYKFIELPAGQLCRRLLPKKIPASKVLVPRVE